jgi:hypothetical protein
MCVVVYGDSKAQPEVWPYDAEARKFLKKFKDMPNVGSFKKTQSQEEFLQSRTVRLHEQQASWIMRIVSVRPWSSCMTAWMDVVQSLLAPPRTSFSACINPLYDPSPCFSLFSDENSSELHWCALCLFVFRPSSQLLVRCFPAVHKLS